MVLTNLHIPPPREIRLSMTKYNHAHHSLVNTKAVFHMKRAHCCTAQAYCWKFVMRYMPRYFNLSGINVKLKWVFKCFVYLINFAQLLNCKYSLSIRALICFKKLLETTAAFLDISCLQSYLNITTEIIRLNKSSSQCLPWQGRYLTKAST